MLNFQTMIGNNKTILSKTSAVPYSMNNVTRNLATLTSSSYPIEIIALVL